MLSHEEVQAAVIAAGEEWSELGLRIHGTSRAPRVGTVLPDSRRYIDGRLTGARLGGVSAMGIARNGYTGAVRPGAIAQALRDLHIAERSNGASGPRDGSYSGSWLLLVGGAYASDGEDPGERVIVAGRVLAVWRLRCPAV